MIKLLFFTHTLKRIVCICGRFRLFKKIIFFLSFLTKISMVWLPSFLLIKTTFTANLALKNVLDTVALSSYPEMPSLDLISVMFLSLDLSLGLQVCLSGSSSWAHPFIIVAALCLTPLFFSFQIHPAVSFTSVASEVLYIPKSLSLLGAFYWVL